MFLWYRIPLVQSRVDILASIRHYESVTLFGEMKYHPEKSLNTAAFSIGAQRTYGHVFQFFTSIIEIGASDALILEFLLLDGLK